MRMIDVCSSTYLLAVRVIQELSVARIQQDALLIEPIHW